jgi:uncharacterized protein
VSKLRISPDLALPEEAVTQTFGILAVRGAGKTHTAMVLAEEMGKAGLPFVVIDPVGVWWGLRTSKDGKGPGLAIPVLGGSHGDVPLEKGGGQLVADLVVDERLSCVLDVSGWEAEGHRKEFLLAFAKRLYHRNTEPLHLFLEEADDYLPQRPMRDEAQLLRAWENIVRRGRARGLGITLISQRSAAVNKNVLTQVETLIVLRTTSPNDRKAIQGWVDYHAQDKSLVESLPSLPTGEAWVWSPQWLGKVVQIPIRDRETFDSSATPKHGKARRAATVADVDLDAIAKAMAATIERAKAEDPKELRRRIAELEKQLKARPAETVVEQVEVPVEVRVEVPVFEEETLRRMEKALEPAVRVLEEIQEEIQELALKQRMAAERALDHARDARNRPQARPAPAPRAHPPQRAQRPPAARTAPPRPLPAPAPDEDAHLKAGARRILETFARHYPMRMTRSQLGTLARFKIRGGTFQTYFSQLKRLGFLKESGGEIQITEAGLDYVGHVPQEPMSTEELLEMWRGALKAGARKMLDELVAVYPKGISREDLALVTDMTVTGGTFQTYLATLRRNGLVEVDDDEVRASDTLFLTGVPA